MTGIRFPAPLARGDVIGITSPSSGVPGSLLPRLDVAIAVLRDRGFEVLVGSCLDGDGIVSASAVDRASELTAMLLDPQVKAVVPPWGGELAVEVLPLLDFSALADVEPTWVVGYSDLSTILLPLTTRLGWATLHGQNLMDTPYRVPEPQVSWLQVVSAEQPSEITQGPSTRHRQAGFDDWRLDPRVDTYSLDSDGGWRLLDTDVGPFSATGRLIGGCIETVSILAGTDYGDVARFAKERGDEGVIVYVEAAESHALDIARSLWRLRLSGWFDRANAVLVGRTGAPGSAGFSQDDAVRSVMGDLGIPVLLDVDCGHLPPHLALVNGARAKLAWDGSSGTLTQTLGID